MKLMVIGNVGFDIMAPYLKQLEIETVLVSLTDRNFHAHLADKTYLFRSENDWRPLLKLALEERVDGVISIAGPDCANIRDSHLKEILERVYSVPVIANPLAAVRIAANKDKTKRWLKSHGFPVSDGKLVRSSDEAAEFAGETGYPLVLKEANYWGGLGMTIVHDKESIFKITPKNYPLLAEKYVSGREFSVEVLNSGSGSLAMPPVFKGYTNFEGIHPMERVKLAPAPLSEVDTARLRRLARKVVAALDLRPTADVDFVWGDDGPQILEINPRFGGVTALSMAASGIPSYHALVDMILERWQPGTYAFKRSFAADLPITPNICDYLIKELFSIEGVFRVKIQKLKQTSGRIALKADTKEGLLEIAKKVALICRSQACFKQLEQLLAPA